jgi:hypothetical protein
MLLGSIGDELTAVFSVEVKDVPAVMHWVKKIILLLMLTSHLFLHYMSLRV